MAFLTRTAPPLVIAALLLGAAASAAHASTATVDWAPADEWLSAPVSPMRAAGMFNPPPERWLAGHRGIDLATTVGEPVRSPGAGVVTLARRVVDRGVVTVDHGGGVVSSFEPVAAPPPVGTIVARGDPIGVVADERHHCPRDACLHWGVRVGGAYVDPLDVLAGFGPVVLLPLDGVAP